MTTSDNKQLLQRIFTSLAECDPRPFADAMAEDFRWTVTGSTSWSRTYEGKQAVKEIGRASCRERVYLCV